MIEINNRKARFDFEIIETIEAGIELKGTEVKSIRNGNANIKDSYAIIKNGECYLLNMHISEYTEGNRFNHDETRTRKLLLHKKEILKAPCFGGFFYVFRRIRFFKLNFSSAFVTLKLLSSKKRKQGVRNPVIHSRIVYGG